MDLTKNFPALILTVLITLTAFQPIEAYATGTMDDLLMVALEQSFKDCDELTKRIDHLNSDIYKGDALHFEKVNREINTLRAEWTGKCILDYPKEFVDEKCFNTPSSYCLCIKDRNRKIEQFQQCIDLTDKVVIFENSLRFWEAKYNAAEGDTNEAQIMADFQESRAEYLNDINMLKSNCVTKFPDEIIGHMCDKDNPSKYCEIIFKSNN